MGKRPIIDSFLIKTGRVYLAAPKNSRSYKIKSPLLLLPQPALTKSGRTENLEHNKFSAQLKSQIHGLNFNNHNSPSLRLRSPAHLFMHMGILRLRGDVCKLILIPINQIVIRIRIIGHYLLFSARHRRLCE